MHIINDILSPGSGSDLWRDVQTLSVSGVSSRSKNSRNLILLLRKTEAIKSGRKGMLITASPLTHSCGPGVGGGKKYSNLL